MTLLEFMRTRVAEDRGAVRAATALGEMHPYGDETLPESPISAFPDEVRGYLGGTWGEHCARWSFERVLADCAALDRVLDAYQAALEADLTPDAAIESSVTADALEGVVRILAQPHNGHRDYQETWRPDVATLTESRTT